MSYLLPKRRLRSLEVLEPRGLNEDVIPCGERASGKFNEHNFNGPSIKAGATLADQAYYIHHYKDVTADPNFGTLGAYTVPDSTDPNAYQIPNSFEWEVVGTGGTDPDDPMSFNFDSGNTLLWIIGWVQYVWLGYTAPGGHSYSSGEQPARVQFAIRLDGKILEETIPGQKDPMSRSWSPVAARPQRTSVSLLPGPQTPRNVRDNTSIGPELMPDRVGTMIAVSQGNHTIELVCRRLRPSDAPSFIYNIADNVFVYNRKFFVLEMHQEPQASTSLSTVTVDAFEAEDTFSAAEISTNRVAAIRTSENAVTSGMVKRGGLNHNHLPSPVIDSVQSTIVTPLASVNWTNDNYPGFTSDQIAATKQVNADGWWLLDDTAGDNLSTTTDHPAAFDVTTSRCIVIVLANVWARSVKDQVIAPPANPYPLWAFGAFAIGMKYAGVIQQIVDESIGYMNSHCNSVGLNAAGGTPSISEEKDIPLFEVFDFSAGAMANVENFGVYASTLTCGNNDARLAWSHGSIQVIQLRY